jgi:hypothetical protein
VHGYQWAHCCDDIRIIECSANHFTLLMPHEVVAGDLDTTVVPAVTDWLRRLGDAASEQTVTSGATPLFGDRPLPEPQAAGGADAAVTELQEAQEAVTAAAEALPPPPAPFVLPPRPAGAAGWVRCIWAREDNLPVWAEEVSLIPEEEEDDGGYGAQQGVMLPDLDLTAGRLALGLNDLAWTASEAPTVVFILHDYLGGAGERWSPLVFATQLPVFGLHAPPGLLSLFDDALALGPDAPAGASAERIALQYLEAVRACLPAHGANCIIAGYDATATLATELALQLRLRSGDARNARHVVSVLLLAPGNEPPAEAAVLCSPAYQALYARVACASTAAAPSWPAFASTLALAGAFERQLDIVAAQRPPGVARASWDAEVDQDVRDTVSLFQMAEARLPCAIASGHVAHIHHDDSEAFAAPAQLPRKGSFARVLRIGRDSARREAASREAEPGLAAPAEAVGVPFVI